MTEKKYAITFSKFKDNCLYHETWCVKPHWNTANREWETYAHERCCKRNCPVFATLNEVVTYSFLTEEEVNV